MKINRNFLAIIVSIIAVFGINNSFAQDLSVFERVDNQSVGLTNAGFAKYGVCLVDIDNDGWSI